MRSTMSSTMSSTTRGSRARRRVAGTAALALMTVPLAACAQESDPAEQSASSEAAAPEPVASIEALTGNSTAILLDQGFLDALTQLKLQPGTVGEATLEGNRLEFPITGGNVTVFEPGTVSPYVIGQLQHVTSGLSLTAGGTTVSLENLNVDPGVSRVYGDVLVNGKVAVESAFLFQLDGRTLNPLEVQGDQAILEGTEVKISEPAAGLLNDTFGTDAVKAGLLVGIAEITVNLPA